MDLHPELKSTILWTAVLVVPVGAVAMYFGNVHGGPGGYYFFIGMVLLLPAFLVGGFLAQVLPHVFLVPLLLFAQFAYWALFVLLFRALWHYLARANLRNRRRR